jgi:hypothetical protein
MRPHDSKMLFGSSYQTNNIYNEEPFQSPTQPFPLLLVLAFHSASLENEYVYWISLNFQNHSLDTDTCIVLQLFDIVQDAVPTCDFLKLVSEEIHDYSTHKHEHIHSHDSSNDNGEWTHFLEDVSQWPWV